MSDAIMSVARLMIYADKRFDEYRRASGENGEEAARWTA